MVGLPRFLICRSDRSITPAAAARGHASLTGWMNGPQLATYGASKSAEWARTNGLRIELAQLGTQDVGLNMHQRAGRHPRARFALAMSVLEPILLNAAQQPTLVR